MTDQELEAVYEGLAMAIDNVGAGQSAQFLAKVVLALSDEFGDVQATLDIIAECQTGLVENGGGKGDL